MNLGQVYTKRMVADYMVGMLTLGNEASVLDPCFGKGVFILSLLENTPYDIDGVEIDNTSFCSFSNPVPDRCHLLRSNFFDTDKTYDGIIMNPPYVRQEDIDAMEPLGVTKKSLQTACGLMKISSKANLYMYFILKAITLLRHDGQLVAIFPNTWVNTPVGRQFYEQMTHHGYIADFITIEGEPFEGKPMVDVCILKFIKDAAGVPTVYRHMNITGEHFTVNTLKEEKRTERNGLVKLDYIASIRRGITTGANKIFVNPPLFTQENMVELLSSPKDLKGYNTQHCQLDMLLAVSPEASVSEEEQTYLDNCEKQIRKERKPATLLSMIEKQQRWYQITLPKSGQIIFSYIVRKNMKFVRNDGGRHVRDNFYMISSALDPSMLMALLNNYHVYAQLEQRGKTYGKGLLKLQRYDIGNILLPHPSVFSASDAERLTTLGQKLAETADMQAIEEATSLLNPYYGTLDSKARFTTLKQKRLKAYES